MDLKRILGKRPFAPLFDRMCFDALYLYQLNGFLGIAVGAMLIIPSLFRKLWR